VNVPVLHKNPMGEVGGPLSPLAPPPDVRRVLRLEVPVVVRLADRKLLLSEVMRLGVGAIIEFVKSSSEPLELLVNNKVIGFGETVKVGENFGLRITQIGDVRQVIRALGGERD
jgi:flagellar motor switch protein FliN/FliY